MRKGKLGVIGGMGPQAGVLFCQRVIDATAARTDQEHLPALLLSDTGIPDRTAALRSGDTAPVAARLLSDARALESWGATAIAITCNTAHAFLPYFERELTVPVVNMIGETAAVLKAQGARRVGVLATDGTIALGLYHKALEARGLQGVSPDPGTQKRVMELIYDQIKAGGKGEEATFSAIDAAMRDLGCDRAVLACTELSVYKDWHPLPDFYLDAMDVLARRCVEVCGYPVKGLDTGAKG